MNIATLCILAASAAFTPNLPKDGVATAAIQKAIDAAEKAGGGKVVIPKGVWRTDSLRLKSHVELHLEKGAVLRGGNKSEDYFEFPAEVCSVQPESSAKVFVYAWDAEDIAITGEGTIDGRGPEFFDQTQFQWTYFWKKPPYPRPRMVQFVRCKGVRLEGTTFKDSPGWTMLIRLCEDIVVKGIRVYADQRIINSDGIDFDGCRRVKVTGCDFSTGDDCLILRAMREDPKDHIVCEDVEVSDCTLDSACQTIRLGCPSDDVIRNAVFRNLKCRGCNGINCESPARYVRPDDEGYMCISNIVFDGYTGEFKGSAIQVKVGPGVKLRNVSDITFRNFNVKSAGPLRFVGNDHSPLKRIRLENVVADVEYKDTYEALATEPLEMTNCVFNGSAPLTQTLVTPRGPKTKLKREKIISWEATKQKKAKE